MIIALLAVLGVDLVVIVGFVAIVVGRRQWLKGQPGEFTGAIRVSSGEMEGLKPKWKKGSGRWVSDVLVWSKAPFMFRNQLIQADRVVGERDPKAGEVKRLGDKPAVIEFRVQPVDNRSGGEGGRSVTGCRSPEDPAQPGLFDDCKRLTRSHPWRCGQRRESRTITARCLVGVNHGPGGIPTEFAGVGSAESAPSSDSPGIARGCRAGDSVAQNPPPRRVARLLPSRCVRRWMGRHVDDFATVGAQ